MDYLLLQSITWVSIVIPFMHQRAHFLNFCFDGSLKKLNVSFGPSYSSGQIVNLELTADSYFIQHLRTASSTYSC